MISQILEYPILLYVEVFQKYVLFENNIICCTTYKYYNTKDKDLKKCTTWTNAYQALIVVLLIVYLNYFKKWLQWVRNAWTAYSLER